MADLDSLLAGPIEPLAWACGDERARGLAALEIARPGLRLIDADGEPLVPRPVFHQWIFAAGDRLLRAHVGFGHLEDHESKWLSGGLAMVATLAEADEPEAWRFLVLSHLASLRTFGAIRARRAEMGDVYSWTCDALAWAGKRVCGDRRCRIDPPSLLSLAAAIHGEVARHRGGDVEAAVAAERARQLGSLAAAWRETLSA